MIHEAEELLPQHLQIDTTILPALINMEELSRVHVIDERISGKNMIKASRIATDFVKRLCRL